MLNILNTVNTTILPWFWFGVLIVCIIVEICTFGLVAVWFAIAAAPVIFMSMTPIAFKWQLLVFALLTVFLLFCTRPFVLKKLKLGKYKSNLE